jgi:NAD+ kinase
MPETTSRPYKFLKRIGVIAHPKLAESIATAVEITSFLDSQEIDCIQGVLQDTEFHKQVTGRKIDLVIAVGGDGTILRAGHLCGPADVPIMGVNLGRFGFLIEVQQNQWREMIPRLLAGEYWLEKRMMLTAEHRRHGLALNSWEVLNEVVVGRGHMVRPVHLIAEVDGRPLTTYVADALIAATPTGSTAYALAVGGPILPPELRNILLVPVAPHLSVDRAIVLAEGAAVSIIIHSDHQAILSIDGQMPVPMEDGDEVLVHASNHTIKFVRFQDPGYFYRNLTRYMNQNPSAGNYR